jgi:hypothetical protein
MYQVCHHCTLLGTSYKLDPTTPAASAPVQRTGIPAQHATKAASTQQHLCQCLLMQHCVLPVPRLWTEPGSLLSGWAGRCSALKGGC